MSNTELWVTVAVVVVVAGLVYRFVTKKKDESNVSGTASGGGKPSDDGRELPK